MYLKFCFKKENEIVLQIHPTPSILAFCFCSNHQWTLLKWNWSGCFVMRGFLIVSTMSLEVVYSESSNLGLGIGSLVGHKAAT